MSEKAHRRPDLSRSRSVNPCCLPVHVKLTRVPATCLACYTFPCPFQCCNGRASHQSCKGLFVVQASKEDAEQPSIRAVLQPFDPIATTADVCVVGCGPAGLALAAELGSHGLSVALVGQLLHLYMPSAPHRPFIQQCMLVPSEAQDLDNPRIVALLCWIQEANTGLLAYA